MNTITSFLTNTYKTLSDALSNLGFLKPFAYTMLGVTVVAGVLELLGIGLSKSFWKQLLIFAAIVGVMLSVGSVANQQTAKDQETSSANIPPPNNLTTPVPTYPNNVFASNSAPDNSVVRVPNSTEVTLPNMVNGIPVDGFIPAIGQAGTYGYLSTQVQPGNSQSSSNQPGPSSIQVVSPEAPDSYSAQEMKLKTAVADADNAMFSFVQPMKPH